jgi:signal transduction histidine kinase
MSPSIPARVMRTVLIVDDNEDNLYLLEVLLRNLGFTAVKAANGVEALAQARQAPPAIVIADILMPVMDGFTLCRQWRQDARLKQIPFIFYTATYTDPKDEAFGLSLGADLFLVKPIEPAVLQQKIQDVLRRYDQAQPEHSPAASPEEHVFLTEYNRALIRKLEGKLLEVEAAKAQLEAKSAALEKTVDQLRQSQKLEAIGQLAAGVAHDFNNILTVIQGNASFLLSDLGENGEEAQMVHEILNAGHRAMNLTRQLLLFSRKQPIQRQPLDLNEVVGNLAKMLGRMLGEDIALELQLDPGLPLVNADPSALEQVLMNLAVNSRDAMPKGGHLRITTRILDVIPAHVERNPQARTGRTVCLEVADTGCGIPPEIREHIFEPFFTTKEIGKGTGLGLSTVEGVVRQHDGWIELDSTLGQGTAFRICLPPWEGRLESALKTKPITPPAGTGETILVVEDELAVRQLIEAILSRQGYKVLLASNGREALKLHHGNFGQVDLMLTDLVMPGGLGGRELAQRMQAVHPQAKVLYCSGYSSELGDMQQASEEAFNFLPKPFTPPQLLEAVYHCLHR